MSAPVVSVILPVLNEHGLSAFVRAVAAVLDDAGHSYEIVIVDDGDRPSVNEPLAPVRTIAGARRGKGRAVRDGMLNAKGSVIVVIDADLEILLPHLASFVERVHRGEADVVIAERQPHWRHRKPIRLLLSYGLYAAQRLVVFNSFRFQDTQCGFKAFAAPVARQLASNQRVDGGMYDIEYLYAAVRNHLRIAQVPVGDIAELRPSRIRLLKCLRTDPYDLLAIKWRGLIGFYDKPA